MLFVQFIIGWLTEEDEKKEFLKFGCVFGWEDKN